MNARLLLILLIIVSEGVIAQDYSRSGLDAVMNQLMQPITVHQQQWQATQLQCANGDDNACIAVNVDPRDPCRSYVANYQERDICRIQQCMAGNQDECRKSQVHSGQVKEAADRENNRLKNRNQYNGSSNEDVGAKYCFGGTRWDYNTKHCVPY